MTNAIQKFGLLFSALILATACISSPAPTGLSSEKVISADGVSTDAKELSQTRFRVETVATGLEVPWGIAFIDAKKIIVTERHGRVRLIENGELRERPIFVVPDVEPSGESGLMDISLHPDFASNSFVYLVYAYREDGKRVKIVRYKYEGETLIEDKIIIDKIPAARNHAGTRARFGPDKKLYVTTGDATDWDSAQETDSIGGKTLRLNDDGSIPEDNPFIDNKDYRPEIWSIGHRNAQGLAWQPETGLMFQTEHGPSHFEGRGGGADEVNIVEGGKNYGWAEIWGTTEKTGMVSPLLEYTPACAPAGAAFYDGDKLPGFKGNLFFACLRGTRLIRVILDGRTVVSQENLLERNYGRIREVAMGPDGYLYFTTSNRDGRGSPADDDDRILRIIPK